MMIDFMGRLGQPRDDQSASHPANPPLGRNVGRYCPTWSREIKFVTVSFLSNHSENI